MKAVFADTAFFLALMPIRDLSQIGKPRADHHSRCDPRFR